MVICTRVRKERQIKRRLRSCNCMMTPDLVSQSSQRRSSTTAAPSRPEICIATTTPSANHDISLRAPSVPTVERRATAGIHCGKVASEMTAKQTCNLLIYHEKFVFFHVRHPRHTHLTHSMVAPKLKGNRRVTNKYVGPTIASFGDMIHELTTLKSNLRLEKGGGSHYKAAQNVVTCTRSLWFIGNDSTQKKQFNEEKEYPDVYLHSPFCETG